MRLILAFSALTLAFVGHADAGRYDRGASERFGPDCRRLYRQTGQATLIVGSVLGGQDRRTRWGDGTFRDYRTMQACFTSVAGCEAWAANQSYQRPHPPGYVRCTPVYVGLEPPASTGWWMQTGTVAPIRARY